MELSPRAGGRLFHPRQGPQAARVEDSGISDAGHLPALRHPQEGTKGAGTSKLTLFCLAPEAVAA